LEYDALDKQILELLSQNSRTSVREISRVLDSSPATVSRRIRKLEEIGIIKGYVSIIEDEELGYDCRALLLIKVREGSDPEQIVERMKDNERICNLYTTIGDYKIITTATCHEENALSEFIDELNEIDGITEIESVLIQSREKILKKVIKHD
jgi:DNA-binding Lrp family transcriptional regulator